MSQKFTLLGLVLSLSSLTLSAQNIGDTVTVSSHVETHMDWFKNYNETTTFPTSGTYKKIIMEYNLGCPSGGCSDWDYTTQINLLNPTGVIDSTLKQAPSFTVDGNQIDTFYYSVDTTYSTEYNSTTQTTDITANASNEVLLYDDVLNPTNSTGTLNVFAADYYTYTYDTNGVATDSMYVEPTDTLYLSHTEYYHYFEVIDKIELGRAITPYANGFSTTWNRQYLFDVTEFAPLLEGTKDIQAHYSGWSDGFTATIDFHFIHGTPTRDVVDFTPLWHASPKYGEHVDGVHTIENVVSEKSYSMDDATYAELTFTPTGHGFGDAENCAEFCAKTFDVISNGTNAGQELIWKDDCGENALFPQPGTWLYDRANWCPGEQVPKFLFDLTPTTVAGNNTIDVNFQNYVSNSGGSYTVDGYVVTYGEFNYTTNVEIVDILAPSDKFDHSRFNPICGNPKFVFKNLSGQNVTAVTFEYGIEGYNSAYYNWTGNLAPLQEAEVELPTMNPYDFAQENHSTFFVKAHLVNNTVDEDLTDNAMTSQFENVKDFPADFRVVLRTNSAGSESAWTITDMAGNILFSQSSPASNQTHETNITGLTQGCYKFTLTDAGKNGLDFWANNAGTGSIKLRKATSNGILKSFKSDFGSKIEYYFSVGTPLSTGELITESDIKVLPNPNNGTFTVSIPEDNSFTDLQIVDITGRTVYTQKVTESSFTIALDKIKSGVYFVKLGDENAQLSKKIVITK